MNTSNLSKKKTRLAPVAVGNFSNVQSSPIFEGTSKTNMCQHNLRTPSVDAGKENEVQRACSISGIDIEIVRQSVSPLSHSCTPSSNNLKAVRIDTNTKEDQDNDYFFDAQCSPFEDGFDCKKHGPPVSKQSTEREQDPMEKQHSHENLKLENLQSEPFQEFPMNWENQHELYYDTLSFPASTEFSEGVELEDNSSRTTNEKGNSERSEGDPYSCRENTSHHRSELKVFSKDKKSVPESQQSTKFRDTIEADIGLSFSDTCYKAERMDPSAKEESKSDIHVQEMTEKGSDLVSRQPRNHQDEEDDVFSPCDSDSFDWRNGISPVVHVNRPKHRTSFALLPQPSLDVESPMTSPLVNTNVSNETLGEKRTHQELADGEIEDQQDGSEAERDGTFPSGPSVRLNFEDQLDSCGEGAMLLEPVFEDTNLDANEAANTEIKRLRTENQKLRERLDSFSTCYEDKIGPFRNLFETVSAVICSRLHIVYCPLSLMRGCNCRFFSVFVLYCFILPLMT
jgi:hypothetical protein